MARKRETKTKEEEAEIKQECVMYRQEAHTLPFCVYECLIMGNLACTAKQTDDN